MIYLSWQDEKELLFMCVQTGDSGSIADMLRATAEEALFHTGYVFDENSGMYYDHSTGFFYDSVSLSPWIIFQTLFLCGALLRYC